MSIIGFSEAVRTARAQALVDALDAVGAAILELYTGLRPATGGATTSQIKLATLTFSNPCGTVSAGVITMSAVTSDDSVDADGIISWGRIRCGDGTFVMDMDATTTAGAGPIKMANLQVYAGGVLGAVSVSLTEGNA